MSVKVDCDANGECMSECDVNEHDVAEMVEMDESQCENDDENGDGVDNVDCPPIELVDQSNRYLLIKEQQEDDSLKPDWQLAKQNNRNMYVKQGLLFHRENVAGLPVEQLAVPARRSEEIIRLAHQTLTGGHMGAQKTRERLKLHFFSENA